jgi:beta-lactamase class A
MAGNVLAERCADARFYSASTIKLGVLLAVIRAVERGELTLDQQLASTHTFTSAAGNGAAFSFDPEEFDGGMPPTGTLLPLREVLSRMISVSSNEATNMAVGLVGLAAVNAALQACGAASSRMERLIGDLDALAAGLTHEVTARDLVALMRAIRGGSAAGPEHTDLMLGWLAAQEFPIIGAELDTAGVGAAWGSKSGWVTGIQHDVAYIVTADCGSSAGYLLAVCTRGFDDADASEAIRTVSRLAWDLMLRTEPPAALPAR